MGDPSPSGSRRPTGPIAYLAPEFPGQTHVWIWREVVHLREWGVDIRLFATRPPGPETAGRHVFAERAREETTYLWPRPLRSVLGALAWALATRPQRLVRAFVRAITLDDMSMLERAASTPLIAPACVFARELAEQDVRHVHVHSGGRAAVIAMMASRLTGVPYSVALNSNLEWWGGGMGSKLGDAAFTAANATWLFGQIRSRFPQLRRSQLLLAPPGVDTTKWVPGDGTRGAAPFRVVTVGRLDHGKGHDVTIRAVARLRDSGRDLRLTLIGGGPERQALQSLVEQLGLDEVVELSGSASEDEVIAQLRSADAFVLASRFEPLGVVYMEAMAMALPTIGTAAGGVGEIITHGHDGLLVPPENDERLADAIARLMDDPDLRRRLGSNARQTIVERFDSRIGAALLYERMCGALPPTSESDG